MKDTTDPRAQRTRALLKTTLSQLLAQKAYRNISIQHILEAAPVSRSTFYAHFESKEALLYSLESELPAQLAIALEQGETGLVLNLLFGHAKQLYRGKKKELWHLMEPSLQHWFLGCWEVERRRHWQTLRQAERWQAVALASLTALLKAWLEAGGEELEPLVEGAQQLLQFCLKQAV
jgi:AcrR family transcriptional regulator